MFTKVIGHEEIKPRLISLMSKPGVYFFFGPPSIGKKLITVELAHYILCLDKKDDGCTCSSCLQSSHPDLLMVGGKGRIVLADVNHLIEFCFRAPLFSNQRVIIIDAVDNMSSEAANRLLKILEESSYTFFLISSDPNRVLPTIMSRCQKIQFKALLQEDVTNILMGKFGFTLVQSRVLGWVGAGIAADIFSNSGLYLKYRDMACEFLSQVKDLLGLLDFIDRIDRSDLSIFVDMLTMILTDILALKNNIQDIVNADKRDVLVKLAKGFNDKALVSVLSYVSQIKRYSYLNVNLSMALKNVIIKTHPLLNA